MDTMEFKSEFVLWVNQNQEEVDHVRGLLREPLSDEPENLIDDIKNAEAWYARMGCLLAVANSWLDRGKKVYLPDKEGRTENDRKIIVDDAISDIRLHRDHIEVLMDSIKQRLILGESILSYSKQFKEPIISHTVREMKPGEKIW